MGDLASTDTGAEEKFEDAKTFLSDEFAPLMELACELQPSAEHQVQLRRELLAWSKVQAQVEKERKTNASLKRQVEKVEAELEELRQEEEKKKNAPPTRRKKQTYKEEPPENELGLEAMNGVAEAFTEVLLPFLGQLVEIH